MTRSSRSFSFHVSLTKFYTIFIFPFVLVRGWLISSYLIESPTSDTVTYSCKFSSSPSVVVEDSSRLGCHTGHLGVIVPWRRRNYVLPKHWVPHIQRHNLTSQETWTQTYTSLPIFTDWVYWDCWWFVQPWPHPKTKWGFQRNPTIGTWQVTQSTQMWKQIKKYSSGTALFSFQEGGQIVSTADKRCASRRQRHVCDNATAGYKELLIIPTRTQHFRYTVEFRPCGTQTASGTKVDYRTSVACYCWS